MTYEWFFSGRPGGVSTGPMASLNLGAAVGDDPAAVAENRRRFAERAGLPAGQVLWMNQVHSATVRRVGSADLGAEIEATDGLVTTEPGLGLAVGVADCVPVLAADRVNGVIAAVHAGRRGAADGIALEMVAQMVAAGAQTGSVEVVLGPAICGLCYEVPPAMQAEVVIALPGSGSRTRTGTAGLDLRAGLEAQLTAAGVKSVLVDNRCTAEDPELFSHRRDAPTGRQAGLIRLTGGVSQPPPGTGGR
ncbi:peptidoglycan editing factor PgeF [Nakamurella silvestris]|nr:peptidoglycan editing factor PgeF [Nakamurella silvestris]